MIARWIDLNSHVFHGNADNLQRFRRLVAEPGLERAVVSGVDLRLAESAAFPFMSTFATGNAEVLALCEEVASAKLVPWCFIDPLAPDPVATLEAWNGRGMRGVKMYPPMGWNADDPRAMAVYAAAQDLDLPVFLHLGRTAAHPGLRSAHGRPIHLEAVGLAFPRLRLVLGHFAAPWQEEAFHIAMGFPAFRFDLSTSGAWDTATLRRVIEHDPVGLGRLVFGSNGDGANNRAWAEATHRRLQAAGFSAAELQAIFVDNARGLLDRSTQAVASP